DAISSLLPLKGKEYQLSVLAEVKVSGRLAVGVNVAAKDREDVKLYFDKETGLLVKREQRVDDDMGGKGTQEEFFSDYKETDQLKLRRKYVTLIDGKKIAEGQVTDVQFLDKIADGEFDKPSPAEAPKQEKKESNAKSQQASETPRQ